ncbi:MAG TPA: 50S ribosomal protein L18, partial [Candidatus Hydrogenedentes bacterium]|nr:50S ribosomal protein L18 [Candidatus Hydrogenedentota bacterium]
IDVASLGRHHLDLGAANRGHHGASLPVEVRQVEAVEIGNIEGAKAVGRALAEKAREKAITRVCFDRGGRLFHGRVKALADAAREAGLEF